MNLTLTNDISKHCPLTWHTNKHCVLYLIHVWLQLEKNNHCYYWLTACIEKCKAFKFQFLHEDVLFYSG